MWLYEKAKNKNDQKINGNRYMRTHAHEKKNLSDTSDFSNQMRANARSIQLIETGSVCKLHESCLQLLKSVKLWPMDTNVDVYIKHIHSLSWVRPNLIAVNYF